MASLFPREIHSPSSRRLQGSWKAELQHYDAVHRPFLPLSLLRAAETSFPTNQDKIWTWGLILTAAQQAGGGGWQLLLTAAWVVLHLGLSVSLGCLCWRGHSGTLQPLCSLKCACLLYKRLFKVFWHWYRDASTDLISMIFLISDLCGSLTTGIAGFLISG